MKIKSSRKKITVFCVVSVSKVASSCNHKVWPSDYVRICSSWCEPSSVEPEHQRPSKRLRKNRRFGHLQPVLMGHRGGKLPPRCPHLPVTQTTTITTTLSQTTHPQLSSAVVPPAATSITTTTARTPSTTTTRRVHRQRRNTPITTTSTRASWHPESADCSPAVCPPLRPTVALVASVPPGPLRVAHRQELVDRVRARLPLRPVQFPPS